MFTEQFWSAFVTSAIFAAEGMVLIAIAWFFLDKVLLHGLDFVQELKQNNHAVAIVIAAFVLAVGLIVFGVTN